MGGQNRGSEIRYRLSGDNALLRLVIFEQWRHRCYWCDEPKLFFEIELDHIIAHTVSRQVLDEQIVLHGLEKDFDVHSAANLAPICGRCNSEKSNRTFAGTLLTGKLAKAAAKLGAVEREVRRIATTNRAWMDAELVDLQLNTPVEILERIRHLHERVQDPTGIWQIDHHTTPDGLTLIFTPQVPDAGPPPIFAFPADEPDAVDSQRALNEIVDCGGDVIIDVRYLAQPDESYLSWAKILGPAGSDGQVLVSTIQAPLDPAMVFHLALVAQSGMVRSRLAFHARSNQPGRLGARIHLQDSAGVFTAHLVLRAGAGRRTLSANLTSSSLVGRFPHEVRTALDLFGDAEPTDRLEIRLNDRSISGSVDVDVDVMRQILGSFRHDAETIAALDCVQSYTGQRFPIPDNITAAERDDVIQAASLLKGHTIQLPGITYTATVFANRIESFLDLVRQQPDTDLVLADVGYQIQCGQHRLDIGRVAIRMRKATIVNMDQLSAVARTGVDVPVEFRPVDGRGAEVRLMEIDGQALTLLD